MVCPTIKLAVAFALQIVSTILAWVHIIGGSTRPHRPYQIQAISYVVTTPNSLFCLLEIYLRVIYTMSTGASYRWGLASPRCFEDENGAYFTTLSGSDMRRLDSGRRLKRFLSGSEVNSRTLLDMVRLALIPSRLCTLRNTKILSVGIKHLREYRTNNKVGKLAPYLVL